MKTNIGAAIIAASVIASAGGALANSITYSGTLSDAVTYHRPSYTNSYTPAFNCTNCGYQSEGISVGTTGAYTFSIVSDNFPDQVGQLYTGSFDPASPMANFDGPLSYALYLTGGARTLNLTAGTQYFWVTSTDFGYAHDKCAASCVFTTMVSGPGAIVANVPEPSSWALMLLGVGGLGALGRSRQRKPVSAA